MADEKVEQGVSQDVNAGGEQNVNSSPAVPLTEDEALASLVNDPEYQALLEEEKKAGGNTDVNTPDKTEDKGSGSTDLEGEPNSTDSTDVEKTADTKTETEESTFEDNILPGLTGKQFETLEEPVKEIIAQTREALDKATESASKAQTELDKLLADPLVKHRKEIIEKGQGKLEYELPQLDNSTVDQLESLLQQNTPESKKQFKTLLDAHIAEAVEIASDNAKISAQVEFERKVNIQKAGEKMIALAKLAKIQLPSDDPNVIANTESSKLGDIGKLLDEIQTRATKGHIGNVVKYLAETDVEELYAIAAVKNEWPLLKNADKVIANHVKDATKKMYDRFYKGKPDEASGSFSKGSNIDQKSVSNKTVRDGIDIVKLATDDNYHEQILYSKQDPKWVEQIAEMRIEGERMIEDNPRLQPSSNKNK